MNAGNLFLARLSSFGRQGDRTQTFDKGEPCRNPLPTLAVQLSGERVFCFQQAPVTYSGSPPVILPPAASGRSGFLATLIVQARVISRLATAATRGDAKQSKRDSPTAMIHGPGNRCFKTVDGSMRGKTLFPLRRDNVSSGIHLRSKKYYSHQPTNERH